MFVFDTNSREYPPSFKQRLPVLVIQFSKKNKCTCNDNLILNYIYCTLNKFTMNTDA